MACSRRCETVVHKRQVDDDGQRVRRDLDEGSHCLERKPLSTRFVPLSSKHRTSELLTAQLRLSSGPIAIARLPPWSPITWLSRLSSAFTPRPPPPTPSTPHPAAVDVRVRLDGSRGAAWRR